IMIDDKSVELFKLNQFIKMFTYKETVSNIHKYVIPTERSYQLDIMSDKHKFIVADKSIGMSILRRTPNNLLI
ncbi:hypothetical protein, partial [Leuconostoc mesenteroides]|uniref:hypothetical protein n=1 Tax=Leuconostoc mesenteroides TaxID=1245 RepID=UPI001CBC057A